MGPEKVGYTRDSYAGRRRRWSRGRTVRSGRPRSGSRCRPFGCETAGAPARSGPLPVPAAPPGPLRQLRRAVARGGAPPGALHGLRSPAGDALVRPAGSPLGRPRRSGRRVAPHAAPARRLASRHREDAMRPRGQRRRPPGARPHSHRGAAAAPSRAVLMGDIGARSTWVADDRSKPA